MANEFEVTGRIVQGHPMKAVPKKDSAGNVIKDANGVTRMVRQFTIAVPIADFTTSAWPAMHAEATSAYPNVMQMKNFAWKYKNPTDVDPKGVPYSAREGYAGNIALSVSSELDMPPPLYRQLPNGTFQQMGPDEIKCGDYVFVRINCKVQVPKLATHSPSLYINPIILIFVGYGSEISGAQIDPNDAFKGRMFSMPAGASAMPVAPSMAATVPSAQQPVQAGMPGMVAQHPVQAGMPGGYAQQPVQGFPTQPAGYAQPGMQAPPVQAGMPGAGAMPMSNGQPAMMTAYPSNPVPVQPAHGFVANAGMPGHPGMQPPPGFPVPGR